MPKVRVLRYPLCSECCSRKAVSLEAGIQAYRADLGKVYSRYGELSRSRPRMETETTRITSPGTGSFTGHPIPHHPHCLTASDLICAISLVPVLGKASFRLRFVSLSSHLPYLSGHYIPSCSHLFHLIPSRPVHSLRYHPSRPILASCFDAKFRRSKHIFISCIRRRSAPPVLITPRTYIRSLARSPSLSPSLCPCLFHLLPRSRLDLYWGSVAEYGQREVHIYCQSARLPKHLAQQRDCHCSVYIATLISHPYCSNPWRVHTMPPGGFALI